MFMICLTAHASTVTNSSYDLFYSCIDYLAVFSFLSHVTAEFLMIQGLIVLIS